MNKDNKALWGIHGSHLDCPILNHRWFPGHRKYRGRKMVPWGSAAAAENARSFDHNAELQIPSSDRSCAQLANPGRNDWKMMENVEPMLKKGLYLSVLN